MSEWFARTWAEPTPPQATAWPLLRAGKNVLIVSPTGTGKTFAAFFPVLDQLARESAAGTLEPTIHALYLSPLRALTYDLEKNLRGPLREIYGETSPIRVGLRSGDTEPAERERQLAQPPHILLTTPESLALLLSQPRWAPHLDSVRWVIVDELHSLAENKRGSHLSLSLARLEARQNGRRFQRCGLSATVAPLHEVAQFLVGPQNSCEIVETATSKRLDLQLYTPLQRNPYPLAGFTSVCLIRDLGKLIQAQRTTLVFCNTRSGAESTTYSLKQHLPRLADRIECHHASLDRDVRLQVEDRLKRGELRCVVCSTSLELGIDIGTVDLVVMLSTPKGVSKAIQRTGRAGHNMKSVSRGLLMATNVNDVVECAATARLARRGHLDGVLIPDAPLDVLAQHLMSIGCEGETSIEATFDLVRKAWPYRELSREDFQAVLDFLAGGGKSLRPQYEEMFGKIVVDEAQGTFEARPGAARRDFLQNVGTIPNDGVVRVLLRNSQLGTVEESFLGNLKVGDVFMLAGRAVRLDRIGSLEAWVSPAEHATPTVPRWGANKMPLSNRVGEEIVSFRSELRARMEALPFRETPSLIPWIARRLECEEPNATIIFRIHAAQAQVSEIPTASFLLVEELEEISAPPPPPRSSKGKLASSKADRRGNPSGSRQLVLPAFEANHDSSAVPLAAPEPALPTGLPKLRHYFFHSLIGRAANDALSRVVARRLSARHGGNAIATPDDYGFVLTVSDPQRVTSEDLPALFAVEGFRADLDAALSRSALLKYHFRGAAQTGLLVYRNYFGAQKSVRKLQWSAEVIFNVLTEHEPDHVLLREARRDAVHSFLDLEGAERFLVRLRDQSLALRLRPVAHVAPLSFGMYATRIKEALLVEDPRETLERLYHQWWQEIGGEADALPTLSSPASSDSNEPPDD